MHLEHNDKVTIEISRNRPSKSVTTKKTTTSSIQYNNKNSYTYNQKSTCNPPRIFFKKLSFSQDSFEVDSFKFCLVCLPEEFDQIYF